jgi:hypothetical protein
MLPSRRRRLPHRVQRQSREAGRLEPKRLESKGTMSATRADVSREQVGGSSLVRTTSADFLKRARYYRFAAALTNTPRDVATFDRLAAMFDQIACRFRRAETRLRKHNDGVPACGIFEELPHE